MASEVFDRDSFPYSATVLVVATFGDGVSFRGTGALVGRNDILTATHVMYAPDHGGWAKNIKVYPGVDFNSVTGTFESAPLVELGSLAWKATGWPTQTFVDQSHGTVTFGEAQYDVALIGIDQPVGETLGWFGLASGYNTSQWAHQLGYPVEGTGLMHGTTWTTSEGGYSIYSSDANEGGDIMGSGSSGGPLYLPDGEGGADIIGVKSSGSDTTSHWADIDLTFDQLVAAIAANDTLLAEPILSFSGTATDDVFQANWGGEVFSGSEGVDRVIFTGPRSDYELVLTEGHHQLQNRAAPDDRDTLIEVERLQFSDGTLALDIGVGKSAGQAFRLYEAAFNRSPDSDGFWCWLDELDGGVTIHRVAEGFLGSAEFQSQYGADPADAELLALFYANVLDRAPDPAGFVYWTARFEEGVPRTTVLASFAESEENYQNTLPLIQDGIWLV